MRMLIGWCTATSVLLAVAGCEQPAGDPGTPRSAAAPQTLRIDVKSLPKVGSPIAPIDEGRLEVAPPGNWHVPPRDRRWLARFQADPGSPYPMIFVTAEDSDATFHVTRDNLDEFVAQVRKELLADADTQRLVAGLQPVEVGSFRGTLYRRWGKSGTRVMERWMLETVANGRRYTLELRSREGLADEYLPHLYAVASGMKFSKGKDAGSALTAIEDPSDEPPADDESADDDDEDDDEVDAP